MSFNEIRPFGPHITGFVRIARESTAADARQLDHFYNLIYAGIGLHMERF